MSHEALAAADVDWIVVCPCGLDLEQTAKELPALTSQPWWWGAVLGPRGIWYRGTGLRARHVLVLVQRQHLCARRQSLVQAHADQHTDAVSGCHPAGDGPTRSQVRHPCHACKGLMSSAYGVWRF